MFRRWSTLTLLCAEHRTGLVNLDATTSTSSWAAAHECVRSCHQRCVPHESGPIRHCGRVQRGHSAGCARTNA
eukprot:1215090-Prymnesium_polylepis.2